MFYFFFFFLLFVAYDASLWNTASSICGDVSPRWHVRSPFITSGTAPLFRSFGYVFKLVNVYVISVKRFVSVLQQGSYPYSPYAMPSPNGMAEASVSYPFS